jgi:uncharacterized protein YdhG (YjbR/CyaY superfamily)
MAKTAFKSVDHYIALQPPASQTVLERVRRTVRRAIPRAEEVISYQIPAYKLNDRPVLYFAGWKQHYSLYPLTDPVLAAFKRELARYEVSRGTIRFPLSDPVPVKLIDAIARVRAKEVTALEKSKRGARKKRLAR